MCKLDSIPEGAKCSYRDQYRQVEKTTKRPHPGLSLPPYPRALAYLVDWARALIGREPLTFVEVKAWADLMDTDPAPFEVEALMRMDVIARRYLQ